MNKTETAKQIVEIVAELPEAEQTVKGIAEKTGMGLSTVKRYVAELVQDDKLVRDGKFLRPNVPAASDVLDRAMPEPKSEAEAAVETATADAQNAAAVKRAKKALADMPADSQSRQRNRAVAATRDALVLSFINTANTVKDWKISTDELDKLLAEAGWETDVHGGNHAYISCHRLRAAGQIRSEKVGRKTVWVVEA